MPYDDFPHDLYQKGWKTKKPKLDNKLLEACQLAYRKHNLNDENIGWEELGDKLLDALCNAMGNDEFGLWLESLKKIT